MHLLRCGSMVARLVWFLIALALLPVRLPWWLLRRRMPAGAWVHVVVEGRVVEIPSFSVFGLFGPRPLSLHALRGLARRVVADSRVKGVLVTVKGLHGGMATATALRDVFATIIGAGKDVVVHLPLGAGSKEIFVATGATRVYAGPQTTLAPLGFVSSTRYFAKALGKLGLSARIFARGTYKSAGETLVREAMSEPQREQLGAILDQLYETLVHGIASGRGVSREKAVRIVDEAPYRARAAVDAGLVDGAAYEDELPALLGTHDHPARIVPAARYLRGARFPLFRPTARGVVGVIEIHGPIVSRPQGSAGLAADEPIIFAIRAARAMRIVRAVVLHVDSPGGSALASDRIHHELAQLAAHKPLVACFGDVAASGGYYVGVAAHHVVAQPCTITGSIGVVAARVGADGLLERIGVGTETIKRGARAGLLDATYALSDDEALALDGEISGVYDAFVDVVAEGRHRPRPEMLAVAEGRVWTGVEAHARGLVDELGGFDVALRVARDRAKDPELEPVLLRPARWRGAPLPVPAGARAVVAELLRERALALSEVGLRLGEID